MIRPRSPIALSLSAMEAARQRRAETAAELRALLGEEAASEALGGQGAPSSPGLATQWTRAALARDQERRRAASPCPEIEARYRELASVAEWEVEPESGPVSLRPGVIELGMWAREEK